MKWRVVALILLLALPGVFAISWLALPLLVGATQTAVPLSMLQIATAVQSSFLVLVAALIGTSVAQKVGLSAPAIFALASGGNVFDALRPQLVPGFAGAFVGAATIVGFYAFAPELLLANQSANALPLVVRVLYGGITEEVLIRWGLMTGLAWTGWKLLQRDLRQPSRGTMWAAIIGSALVFGVSHVPSAAQSLPTLSMSAGLYITIGNSLFGLMAGYLFWRYGLESAIAAHIGAHVLAFIVRG